MSNRLVSLYLNVKQNYFTIH